MWSRWVLVALISAPLVWACCNVFEDADACVLDSGDPQCNACAPDCFANATLECDEDNRAFFRCVVDECDEFGVEVETCDACAGLPTGTDEFEKALECMRSCCRP